MYYFPENLRPWINYNSVERQKNCQSGRLTATVSKCHLSGYVTLLIKHVNTLNQ